ncbi:hypothetical protein [Phytohabitans houttuyneae]|uniref:hypothetical protein n=1 Tax=Phytohabitans houttuyneae TaxID=1076126 RepID=UPI001562F443|nr:hypothetical protein [Phytohabitans houttuyneae]
MQNRGPTTVYTDVYGRNASSTPFTGSIRQYFAGKQQHRAVRPRLDQGLQREHGGRHPRT